MKAVLYYADSTCSYCMFEKGRRPEDYALEDDAILIATFEGETWEDICRQECEFLGHEYTPFDSPTPKGAAVVFATTKEDG